MALVTIQGGLFACFCKLSSYSTRNTLLESLDMKNNLKKYIQTSLHKITLHLELKFVKVPAWAYSSGQGA